MNSNFVLCFSSVVVLLSSVEAKIAVDVLGYSECPGRPEGSQDIDFSNLEFDLDDDGHIVMNGNLTILRDINAPFPLYMHSERLERGQWHPAIVNKKVDCICKQLLNPTESWYTFTSHMKRQKCPFPRGHVETVRNLRITRLPFAIPPNFIGEWRIHVESVLAERQRGNCTMLQFMILEI